MKTLVDHLAQYAAYHRDRRNIATHFVGIPMILLGVATLLSRSGFEVLGVVVSPAMVFSLASALFYWRLDGRYGLVMTLVLGGSLWFGQVLATQAMATGWARRWACSSSGGSSSSSGTTTRGASRPSSMTSSG
ncbi:DUF962 domain-containing protein [Cystobacter fuscus]